MFAVTICVLVTLYDLPQIMKRYEGDSFSVFRASKEYDGESNGSHHESKATGSNNDIDTTATEVESLLHEYYEPNHNQNIACEFQKPYESAPVPVLLLSQGRSGSSVTWDTISTMLGSTTKAYEITGGNRTKSALFFDSIENEYWPINKLCQTQKYNMHNFDNPVISGFQWKPFRVSLNHPMGKAALDVIANYEEPPIKVLYLMRNPLDRVISNLKHKGYQHNKEVPAHCAIDDQECINRHKSHSRGTVLPTGRPLINSIKGNIQIHETLVQMLSKHGVKHLSVSYEKLYNDERDVSEWIRIFDYLGREPKDVKDYRNNLTMNHVEDAFAMAPTSSKSHEDTIANYKEVKETLVDAGMDYLLH